MQGDRPVKFEEQCKDISVNDPKFGYTPIGRVCVKVFDNPTEAYVKMVSGDGITLKNGRFPIGEDGQKFEHYFPGLGTRSFYLYVILEPNNSYVEWKLLDVCTPDKPNCNDNKPPLRLISFTPDTSTTPATSGRPVKFEEGFGFIAVNGERVGTVRATVLDNPTEVIAKVILDGGGVVYEGPIPIGDEKTVFQGHIPKRHGDATIELAAVLEPDDSYVIYHVIEEKPSCAIPLPSGNCPVTKVKQPPVKETPGAPQSPPSGPRLITFTPATQVPDFPMKCEPYTLTSDSAPTVSGKICANLEKNLHLAAVQVYVGDEQVYNGEMFNGGGGVIVYEPTRRDKIWAYPAIGAPGNYGIDLVYDVAPLKQSNVEPKKVQNLPDPSSTPPPPPPEITFP